MICQLRGSLEAGEGAHTEGSVASPGPACAWLPAELLAALARGSPALVVTRPQGQALS